MIVIEISEVELKEMRNSLNFDLKSKKKKKKKGMEDINIFFKKKWST